MEKYNKTNGKVLPLDRANVDTDQIIPAKYLKRVERTGFGQYLFDAWRKLPDGTPNPEFILNDDRYNGATILVAGPNFGSGSSREHAPWALNDYGFRTIIAPSFADIFRNNCFQNGMLPIVLDQAIIDKIIENDPNFLTIGNEGSKISAARYSSNIVVSMLGFVMWPHLFTKSYTTTARRIKLTVLVYPIFAIFLLPVLFIGFSGIGIVPDDALGRPGEVLPYLITHHLTESGILYGIVGAGALAAAMSSSDAITHGASVSFGRDICKVIFPSLKENQELWIMRLAVIGVGAISYCIAIYGSDGLIALLLGAYGAIVQLAPGVCSGLFWKKASTLGVIIGLIVGIIVTIYFQYIAASSPYDLHPGLIGVLLNIAIVFFVSVIQQQNEENYIHASKFVDE